MTNNTYNGWTNYATWRINLEIIDNLNPEEFGLERDQMSSVDMYILADAMKERVTYYLECETEGKGLAYSYALAFVDEVDFQELAQAFIETYSELDNCEL